MSFKQVKQIPYIEISDLVTVREESVKVTDKQLTYSVTSFL